MYNENENKLRDQFFGWQCRIRQHAVRKQEGRPPPGVRASAGIAEQVIGEFITLICKQDPEKVIAEFEFLVKKTDDPRSRYESALAYLCEYYYQFPREFDNRLTALFALDSELGLQLVNSQQCELGFSQGNQQYLLVCRAFDQDPESPLYQATYWHNHLFNPGMPGVVRVVGFDVDWNKSQFTPLALD